MNFNETLKCLSCYQIVDCRIGMSNRAKQPLRFACPGCSAPIDIDLEYGSGINFNGAVRVEGKSPFDNSNPFIDLHLNFPAYMGKYEMGMTPFMSAVSQVSLGDHQLHNARLNALNAGVKSVPFSKIL